MKILFLLSSNRYSGAENVVCQIAAMFRDQDDMELIYCSPDGEIRSALLERNIAFYPIFDITVSEVRRAIKTIKPDIVHAHDMRASFIAALACGKTPLVSHIHNNAFDARKISPKSLAYLYAGCKAKHIFWVSQSSYDGYIFHRLFKAKSEVLYNIIDVDKLYEKMNSDVDEYFYDVVYLGRLTYQKNPHRLLEVFSKVLSKRKSTKFAVIGTGELFNEIKELAEQLNIANDIDFLGFQSNPLKILHSAKVMVMTSRWEGTPMCALESLALGVPIVSTPVDGLKDLVVDDINGYISDDDEIVAQKIVDILNDPELHEKLSANAKAKSLKINDTNDYKHAIYNAYVK